MIYRMNIVSFIGSIMLLVVILGLVKSKRLSEKYSLLWIVSTILMIVLSIWRDLLAIFARLFGVAYAPSFLFIAAIFFGMVIALHFSMVITELYERQIKTAQEIARLTNEVKELKKKLDAKK